MEVPSLVRNVLGGEEIEASVNLGDEDTVYLTGSRTLLYRAEGLLSDEKVEEFPHTVERLDVKEGRRKTKFTLEYVDGTQTFTVPSNRDEQVLELLMTGVLRAADITDTDETLEGVFRFSELALFVTDSRVVKHIGADVWTDDYEVYHFDDLTKLSFEKGSVATGIVIEVGGRPQRIKTPNERAREVQQVIENAVFQYHGVSSLAQLNEKIGQEPDATAERTDTDSSGGRSSDIEMGSGIDPLVTDHEDEDEAEDATIDTGSEPTTTQRGGQATAEQSGGRSETAQATQSHSESATKTTNNSPTNERSNQSAGSTQTERQETANRDTRVQSDEELTAVKQQLTELTETVQKQGELIEQQQETINQLIKELREGR